MVIAVGIVMGVHALYTIFVGGTVVTWHIAMVYLPVSLLYISSMTLGYIGLRYIELSISSPICNSSGALVAVLCFLTGTLDDAIEGNMRLAVIGAVALVCIGVIGLGIVESREDDELRRERQAASNYKYAKSWLALFLPCLLYTSIPDRLDLFISPAVENNRDLKLWLCEIQGTDDRRSELRPGHEIDVCGAFFLKLQERCV